MLIVKSKSTAVRSLGPILGTPDPMETHKAYTQVIEEKGIQFKERWNFDPKAGLPKSSGTFSLVTKKNRINNPLIIGTWAASLDGEYTWNDVPIKLSSQEDRLGVPEVPELPSSSTPDPESIESSEQQVPKSSQEQQQQTTTILLLSSSASRPWIREDDELCFRNNKKITKSSSVHVHEEGCCSGNPKESVQNQKHGLKQRRITDYMKVRKACPRSKKHMR